MRQIANTPTTIDAHIRFVTVSIIKTHAEICSGGTFNEQQSIGTDSGMRHTDLLNKIRGPIIQHSGSVVNHNKIIARTMHFIKLKIH